MTETGRDVQRRVASKQVRAVAITGLLVVAPVLALSRWGTYIGVSPIFISDVLLLFVIAGVLVNGPRKRPTTAWASSSSPSALFILFLSFVALRAILSLGSAPVLDLLRDAVPFLYGILAFLSAASFAASDEPGRAKSIKIIWIALLIHLAWVGFSTLTGNRGGFALGTIFSAPVFQVRPDIDAALLAITAGLCLRQMMLSTVKTSTRWWALVGLCASAGIVLGLSTRAGLISLLACLALSFGLTYAAARRDKRRLAIAALAVPLVVIALLVVIPATTPGQRLLASIDPTQSVLSDSQQNAQGTQRARQLVWSGVVEWTNQETARQLFGSGFGNDFLAESGTLRYLEGSTYDNVRSPHNWFVGAYARLGIIGIALIGGFILQLFGTVLRSRMRIGGEPLLFFAAMTIIALLPVATLGVVLESPFGAIPFFWAAGLLFTLRGRFSRADVPHRVLAGSLPIAR